MKTKKFSVRTILSVTTGRLLTKSKGPRDNGIGDMCKLLEWMTDESPFTHQLPRFGKECKPWLLEWFPELAAAGEATGSLDQWLNSGRTGDEAIKTWLAELKLKFPAIQDEYDVPKVPAGRHEQKDAIEELAEMMPEKKIIIVE